MNMHKNSLLVILGLVFCGVSGLTLYAARQPNNNFVLEVAPNTAIVALSSEKKITPGNLYLKPGNYTLTATMPGFADSKQRFTVPVKGAIKLTVALTPISSEGYTYLQDHPDQQLLREKIGGSNYISTSDNMQYYYPIIKLLPHDGEGYSINYGKSVAHSNNPASFALYISYSDSKAQLRALKWITYNGFDSQDYEIVYQSPDAHD